MDIAFEFFFTELKATYANMMNEGKLTFDIVKSNKDQNANPNSKNKAQQQTSYVNNIGRTVI